MDAFLALLNEHNQRNDLVAQTAVDEVVFDDLGRVELAAVLRERLPGAAKLRDGDLVAGGGATLADLFGVLERKGLAEVKVAPAVQKRENLYFKRLLHGAEVSVGRGSDPMSQMRFQVAKQMRNYSYLVGDRSLKQVLVVDPCWDVDGVLRVVNEEGLTCVGAICTHYHWDHVGGVLEDSMLARLGVPPAMYATARILPGVKELMATLDATCKAYAHEKDAETIIKQTGVERAKVHATKHNERFNVGDMAVRVLHTPGHTPGSQCLVLEAFQPMRVLTGDTMFVGSFGRIDGADCSAADLWESLNVTLGALPDDTIVFPAHDYSEMKTSTIEQERRTNPAMRIPKAQFVASYGSKY